jgi:hypothetical protein
MMNPSQWGCATPHLPLQEANVSEPLTGPRVTTSAHAAFAVAVAPPQQLQELGIFATPTPLLIAFALPAGLSILPAPARSDAGNTLRLMTHIDLSIVDRQFSGVYITSNFGYLVYGTLLAFDHEL